MKTRQWMMIAACSLALASPAFAQTATDDALSGQAAPSGSAGSAASAGASTAAHAPGTTGTTAPVGSTPRTTTTTGPAMSGTAGAPANGTMSPGNGVAPPSSASTKAPNQMSNMKGCNAPVANPGTAAAPLPGYCNTPQ